MTTITDPAAVILDRAAAGKTLSAEEIAVLRARVDRNPLISDQEAELRRQVEQLQELVARRSEIFRAYRERQAEDGA